MSELEELGKTLLFPCQRASWEFDGNTYPVEVTAMDLADERTWRSHRVLAAYDWYEPEPLDGFLVHNREVKDLLTDAGTRVGLQRLRDKAMAEGLFEVRWNHDLVVTCTAAENPAMHVNRWITDSVHNLALVGDDGRKARILRVLAAFYCTPTEQAAFRRVIENPARFRDSSDTREGVAHIFQIETTAEGVVLKRDPRWANNKRLESHGLALRAFCDFLRHQPPGAAADSPEQELCTAIASLALYVQAIDYPTAPSAGAWEEVPLPGGLSWDTEAIRQGLAALDRLLFEQAGNPQYLHAIRDAGRRLASGAGQDGLDGLLMDRKALTASIDAGARQVRQRVREKAEAPGMRSRDASLAFLAQSDLDLVESADPGERAIETARLYTALLEDLESGLVRSSGMIRYEPFALAPGKERVLFDAYLTANYWLGFDEDGFFNPTRTRLIRDFQSSDASDPAVFTKRAKLGVPQREAEWFLVTEMARGYARQARRLEGAIRSGSDAQRRSAQELFKHCTEKAFEYVKRGYARITPAKPDRGAVMIKSNGESCPPWGLPEAYEWVRIRANAVGRGDGGFAERILPGADTSLAWAAASLKLATEEVLSIPAMS